MWALAAFTLAGALPFLAALLAEGASAPSAQEHSSGGLEDVLVASLYCGISAALATYAVASIPAKTVRSMLLCFAATGSAAVGFVIGFIGVLSVTSPTVGDH